MTIPLANRIGQLNTPQAEPGRAFDNSQAISNTGQMAQNTFNLLSKATANMGDAITLVQRNREDVASKETILRLSETVNQAMAELEKHQGLDAEKYRNGEFAKIMHKAENEAIAEMDKLSFSDIKNNAIENFRDIIADNNARADIYSYKENLSARNTMSKEIRNMYARRAISAIGTKDFDNIVKEYEVKTKDEALNMAGLNGLTDQTYKDLKSQEALDEYHIQIMDAISHLPEVGFKEADKYWKAHKSEISTAAFVEGLRKIESDHLSEEFYRNPQAFMEKGEYSDKKAADVAPNLNPWERERMWKSQKSASDSGSGQEAGFAMNAAVTRWLQDATIRSQNVGMHIANPEFNKSPSHDNTLKESRENTRLSDFMKSWLDNEKSATSPIVFDKMANSPVEWNPDEATREKQWAMIQSNPSRYYIMNNITGLLPQTYDLGMMEVNYGIEIAKREYDAGLGRKIFSSTDYSTVDGIVVMLHKMGLDNNQIFDVVKYMSHNKNHFGAIPAKNEKGEDIYVTDKRLVGFDLFKRGAYDAMVKANPHDPRIEAIQSLLHEAVMEQINTKQRQNITDEFPKDIVEVNDLLNFIKQQQVSENQATQYKARSVTGIGGTPAMNAFSEWVFRDERR